jgi:hypothetical protein
MGCSGLGATRLEALTEAPSTLIVLMVMGSPWSGSRSRGIQIGELAGLQGALALLFELSMKPGSRARPPDAGALAAIRGRAHWENAWGMAAATTKRPQVHRCLSRGSSLALIVCGADRQSRRCFL